MSYTRIANTLDISHDEWLSYRKKGIGGSDIGAIMGLNPWSSPFNVFIDKTTDYINDISDNDAVYWGTVLEDVVAREFAKRTGKRVTKLNAMLQSDETPFAFADIDRRIVGEYAGLECKTTNAYNYEEWKGGEVPASYICQCQWYMYVTGFEKWYIACLIGGQHFIYKEIQRDDELIQYMVERATEFWLNNVLKNEAPYADSSESCTEYLKNKYPDDNGEKVMLTSDYISFADELMKVKEQEKILKKRKNDLENKLKQYLGEAEIGQSEHFTVTWKTQNGAPKLDKETLAGDIGAEVLSKYYIPQKIRKFIIKETK